MEKLFKEHHTSLTDRSLLKQTELGTLHTQMNERNKGMKFGENQENQWLILRRSF